MTRLTVVQLLPALQSGGVERSTLEVAEALVQAGHRAIVVSAGGRLVPSLEQSGAEHVLLNIGNKSLTTLRHISTLRQLFVREKVGVVHARSRLPAWIGHFALRGLAADIRPHFVTTVHGLNSVSRYSGVMTSGERVICVSETVRQYVLQNYPKTPETRLSVIPRGIDIKQFAPVPWPDIQARQEVAKQYPALAGKAPLLLLPGRGTRLKGHKDAITLVAGLHAAGCPALLWMPGAREVGRERYLAELEQYAHQLGVADALVMSAPTTKIHEAYAASDLVLQLSRKPEAFGRTVVEALAVGRAVLGWGHGGVGELLQQLQPQGMAIPFDEANLLVKAQALLSHSPLPWASTPYTLQQMQQATLTLYQEFF